MPTGRVQRIDDKQEIVYLVRRGHSYTAPLSEVESKARVPSARVSFDLVRREGAESAANVRLRSGTRTNRRHRRFGDLSGARRPGAKVSTIAKQYGLDVTTQPFRVATAWLAAMEGEDFDGAASMYLPEATLHTPDGPHVGRRQVRAELERSPAVGVDADSAEVRGLDRYVRIGCEVGGQEHTTYLVIERGAIAEQWIDTEPELSPSGSEASSVQIVCRGDVPEEAKHYADDKISHLISHTGRPATFARIKLTKAENPAVRNPTMAEATVEFDKLLIRAHSDAESFSEAIDLVASRLQARIEHQRGRENRKPTGQEAPPGTWRHGNVGPVTSPYFERPVQEREIVRHKSFAADELTVDEAAWDMTMLDYDFFLFVDTSTGVDSLLERADSDSLLLHRMDQSGDPVDSTVNEVKLTRSETPELTVSEAIEFLNQSGNHLHFFANGLTGRGNVVYRRFDGHYGLITPPSDDIA